MEDNRDFKGVWIPREIWLDTNLNMIEKGIFTEIDSLDKDEKGCFASNKYFADFCQCSETKVSTAISKLKQLGYVYEKSFDGRQRVLKSRLTKNENQPYKNLKAELQNSQDNNISNNSLNNKDIKKERKTFDGLIDRYITESGAGAEVRELLGEWLKVRKAKRSAMTDRAIELNLTKLDKCASESNLTVAEYLKEVICRGWQAFYPIKTFNTKQEQAGGIMDDYNAFNELYQGE